MNDMTVCGITSIQRTGHRAGRYNPLPRPSELPAGLPANPRVLLLADLDDVSRGLAGDTRPRRASYRDVERCLGIVQATAHLLDPQSRIRCAASAATAAYYLDALAASGNSEWLVCPGTYDVSQALIEEMSDLVYARLVAALPERGRPKRRVDLVILVGQDRIYAPLVTRLRLLGIPTWLIVPGRFVAPSLYRGSCAVRFIGSRSSDPVGDGQPGHKQAAANF
jgi:hypothetical protein